MNGKFKVGDRVRDRTGKTYTVTEYVEHLDCYECRDDHQFQYWFVDPRQLEDASIKLEGEN